MTDTRGLTPHMGRLLPCTGVLADPQGVKDTLRKPA